MSSLRERFLESVRASHGSEVSDACKEILSRRSPEDEELFNVLTEARFSVHRTRIEAAQRMNEEPFDSD